MTSGRAESTPSSPGLLAARAFPDKPSADVGEPIDQIERLAGYERMSSDLASVCDQLHQMITDFVASVDTFVAEHPDLEWLETDSREPDIKQFVELLRSQLQKYLEHFRAYEPILNFWLRYLPVTEPLRLQIGATHQLYNRVIPFAMSVLSNSAVGNRAKMSELQARAKQLITFQETDTAPPAETPA